MYTADIEFGEDDDNHIFVLNTSGEIEGIKGKYLEPNSEVCMLLLSACCLCLYL